MKTEKITELLAANPYPGRGIVTGLCPDGRRAVIAYFIMGRSVNSRNRVFAAANDGIFTMAADDSKLSDPTLIIYHPVRRLGEYTIVTNGDQTDTIRDSLAAGGRVIDALETRTFEPDAPNWTPRISAVVAVRKGELRYFQSILKSADGNGDSVRRYYFSFPQPVAGEGHFIHTYRCDGNPIPSFEGEPVKVAVRDDVAEFADEIWQSLDNENKVSLFVRCIDLESGDTQDIIHNKYERVEETL